MERDLSQHLDTVDAVHSQVKELIEQSNIDKKDLILSRMEEEDFYTNKRFERYESTISEQRQVIESYRTVLQDVVYSNWLNK